MSDCPTLSSHSSEDRANASPGEDWSGGRARTATAQPLTLGKRLQAAERVGARQAPCPRHQRSLSPLGPAWGSTTGTLQLPTQDGISALLGTVETSSRGLFYF